jgi:tetratricopeptide (TPR) repeat protein
VAPDHIDSHLWRSNLGDLYRKDERYSEAQPILTKALELAINEFGPDHPSLVHTLRSNALLHQALGNFKEAQHLFTSALEIAKNKLGLDHPITRKYQKALNEFMQNQKR